MTGDLPPTTGSTLELALEFFSGAKRKGRKKRPVQLMPKGHSKDKSSNPAANPAAPAIKDCSDGSEESAGKDC